MAGIMDQIKAHAKGTMPGPNGALVPGPGGEHSSNQRNQAAIDNFDSNNTQGNLGRGFDTGLDQGNNVNSYDNTSAGMHGGNTVGNIGSSSHAPQGTGFGGTIGTGISHTGTALPHTGTHTGHGMHEPPMNPTIAQVSPTPILGGEGSTIGHTGTHTGHGMHGHSDGHHGHNMGTGVGTGVGVGSGTHTGALGLGQTGVSHHTGHNNNMPHMGQGTDPRTGHMAGDDSHSYGAGVGPDHKAGHKVSKATKGAQYDATGGAVDDRTVGQKIKDAFTPGSDVGKHTQH